MNRANERRNGSPFDPRTTAEVESSRSDYNGKPYRGKQGRLDAQSLAIKNEKGYFTSTGPVSHHPQPKGNKTQGD